MVTQNPRDRVVVFRLTQAELDTLKSACAARGGRNLSEFARSELLNFLRGPSFERVMESRFGEIQQRVEELQRGMQQIASLLERRVTEES
jgi:hypothetical protein